MSLPLLVMFLLAGCADTYNIGYSVMPLGDGQVRYTTPVLVRALADDRPLSERYEPDDVETYRFHSCDISFSESVSDAVTRALRLELANAGFEVAESNNHIIGDKPYIRVGGEIEHFVVTRKLLPIDTLQHDVTTLWRRERYTVRVALRLWVIDTLARKKIMQRVYESSDSLVMRSEMMDALTYETEKSVDDATWRSADNQFCIDLLNEHLQRVLVRARKDISRLMAPARVTPGE